MPDPDRAFRFGPFALAPDRRRLTCRGQVVPFGGRPFDLLAALVERAGRVVPKEELKSLVWPDAAIVEDHTLVVTIASVRKALSVELGDAKVIATIPGRGYQFLPPVQPGDAVDELAGVDRAAVDPAGRLPVPPDRLVGREDELATLLSRLPEARLLTLWGAGGIGKTRLALALAAEAARHYPDGVWLVELAPLADPRLVAETTAAMFDLAVLGGRSALDTITTFLRRKRLLIVLDNCEHLIEASATLVDAIIRHCAGVTVLATSRERLSIAGEAAHRVKPLTTPDDGRPITMTQALRFSAVCLFVERADAVLGTAMLTEKTVSAVVEICRRLDGLALAIELAVAGLELLTPAELLARLDSRFRLSVQSGRARPSRHRTLRAMIDWSYDLLSEPERTLLRRLSLFAGSFTVAAARAVARDDPAVEADAVHLLLGLIDKSLVVPLATADEERRFRLLESTRAYGQEKLSAPERSRYFRDLARYLGDFYEQGDHLWATTPTEDWLAAYEPHLETLRTVLDWAFGSDGDAALGLRLVAHAQELWAELSLFEERRRWLECAEVRVDAATPPAVLARLRLAIGRNAHPGDPKYLNATLEALALFGQIGDPLQMAVATDQAGRLSMKPGDVAQAQPYLQEGLARLRALGPTKFLAAALFNMVVTCWFTNDMAGAQAHLDELDPIALRLGDTRMLQMVTMMRAELDFATGRPHAAIDRARAAQARWRAEGHANALANISRNLASYLAATGDAAGASEAAREAIRLSSALGKSLSVVFCIQHLALAYAIEGQSVDAARFAGYSDAYFRAKKRTRERIEQILWDELAGRLDQALPPADLSALQAEGAAWSEEQAVTAALAESPSQGPGPTAPQSWLGRADGHADPLHGDRGEAIRPNPIRR